ncbi:DUF2807 domain-containing protein [Mucilaginibacter sp. HC2]|uniref:GIN domain-containing protein n=1 Tax=Mucilaginibacter inviolabilis TaxID=2714892 RepID=UPI00140DD88B|nr:DUF2807 domain-containing protein [Mucilaginibacter inviolabilis]NHA06944.1 DUF2807 domain-containing protein [Mucilaginibacter inviolabilis]
MIEIKGNGNIVSKEIPVSSFIRLHLASKGLIELVPSDEEKVLIETDENLLDYFEAVNSGRTLYISSEAKFRRPSFTRCNIKVYLRHIDTLYIRCDGGDVNCSQAITLNNPLEIKIQSMGNTTLNIYASAIKVLNQCAGNVTLKGKCGTLTIKNQSEGNLFALEMVADDLIIKNMAEGNVELYANRSISIAHWGQGDVHYAGNALLTDVKQYGDGIIKHVK